MTLNKMESSFSSSSGSEGLVYFQNLVPGTQDSAFIDRYKNEVLANEPVNKLNEERRRLLNEDPPVLSFTQRQKMDFYMGAAGSCQPFCCGSMGVHTQLSGDQFMTKEDHYMSSTGSGKLYEGSADAIKTEMQNDMRQQPFGSEGQNKMVTDLQQFEAVVAGRSEGMTADRSHELGSGLEQSSAPNPLSTKPTNS